MSALVRSQFNGSFIMKDASFYNEDYFKPRKEGGTGTFGEPFTWEFEGERRIKTAGTLIEKYEPKKVLDVGCAKGFLVKALLQKQVFAYGCDISKWAVKHCEPEVEERLKVSDIRFGLPYTEGEFDLVYSNHTLEHIEMEYLDKVVSEMYRVTDKWIEIGVPVTLGYENDPWGDPSHVTYMPISYWISLFYKHKLLIDLTRSQFRGTKPFYNVDLCFYKRK